MSQSDLNESERLGRAYLRLFQEHDLSVIEELIHPDFVSHLRVGEVRGHAGFRALMESFFSAFPDARWEVDEWIFTADRVVIRYHWQGTLVEPFMGIPAQHQLVRTEGLELLHLRDGKVTEVWNYSDLMGLAATLQAPSPLSIG